MRRILCLLWGRHKYEEVARQASRHDICVVHLKYVHCGDESSELR